MTNTNLVRIEVVGKRGRTRPPPDGMQVNLTNPGIVGLARVQIMLPGRTRWNDLGLLPIENEQLSIPVSLAFLCHAEPDEAAVSRVGDQLEEDGVVTWFAPKSLTGGADWKREIDEAIAAADFAVVFLSRGSANRKGYFQREVKHAFDLREELPDGERFIIPVLVEEFTPPARFDDIHWIKLYEADGYDRLKKALTDLSVRS